MQHMIELHQSMSYDRTYLHCRMCCQAVSIVFIFFVQCPASGTTGLLPLICQFSLSLYFFHWESHYGSTNNALEGLKLHYNENNPIRDFMNCPVMPQFKNKTQNIGFPYTTLHTSVLQRDILSTYLTFLSFDLSFVGIHVVTNPIKHPLFLTPGNLLGCYA